MTSPVPLNCPSCGGVVSPPVTSRRTSCQFCSQPLYYTGGEFLSKLLLPPALSDAGVQERCRLLFRSPLVPKKLALGAVLLKKRRSFLPFYLLTGKRGGVLAVGKERIVGGGMSPLDRMAARSDDPDVRALARFSSPKVLKEEDSRVILGDFRYVYSAAVLENWEILDTDLRATLQGHLDAARPAVLSEMTRTGDVVDPDIPLERILEKGVAPGDTSTGEMKILEMRTVLVYLPILTLTFRYGEEVFSVSLEELEGRWIAGSLPFRKDRALLTGIPLVAVMGWMAGNALAGFLKFPLYEWVRSAGLLVVPAFVGASLLFLGLQACWVLLRTPYLVRLRGGQASVEAAGPLPPSPIEPLNALYRVLFRNLVEGQRKEWWSP
jgi:hypothetical protein